MKKGIYLTTITLITIICIIGGSIAHFGNFFSDIPFRFINSQITRTEDTTSDIKESASSELEIFNHIVADVDVSDIIVKHGTDYSIEYQATKKLAPTYEVKDDTLTIKQTVKHRTNKGWGTQNNSCKITITIPKNATLISLDLDSGVGDIIVDSITATELITDSSVGDTEIKHCTIDSMETDSSVGDTDIIDCGFEILDSDSDIGDISVRSAKDLSDYEIELDTNLGDVSVNNRSYKRSFSKSGSSGCSVTLDNSTGDITLTY